MRTLTRILGLVAVVSSLVILMPPALLLNQRFQFVRQDMGFFDMRLGGVPVSNITGGIVLACIGVPLLVVGALLTFRRSGRVA